MELLADVSTNCQFTTISAGGKETGNTMGAVLHSKEHNSELRYIKQTENQLGLGRLEICAP